MKLTPKGCCPNCWAELPSNKKGYCKECDRESNLKNYYKHREKRLERMRVNNRVNGAKYKRTWRARHPVEADAQSITTINLKNGMLTKQPCSVCGAKKVEAHHPNYLNCYEIVWLCRPHHLEAHRQLKKSLTN